MPPDTHAVYDLHLERTVRDLEDIRDDLSHDVFMVYCHQDIPLVGEKRVQPRKIHDDLVNNGFKVYVLYLFNIIYKMCLTSMNLIICCA